MTYRTKKILLVLSMFVFALLLWDTVVLYPIKLFVVFLHELSHGLSAILCGGSIKEIIVQSNMGGLCRFYAPSNFICQAITSSAGYIGSILWGSLILYIALKTRYHKQLAMFIGALLIIVAAFYIKPFSFGFIFAILFGIFMILLFKILPQTVGINILQFMGVASSLYAIIDIKEDLIERTVVGSDSYQLAMAMGAPGLSMVIGIIWMAISLFILYMVLKKALR